MKLPALAIGCFQRQCQEDIDRIWTFMEGRTPAELRSDHFIRTLRGFRNTLWLQFSQMSRAWRNHDPYEGDADVRALAKLGTIVEATRVAVSHVLKVSGDVLSEQLSQKSDAASDPNPYTSLSQFLHRAVRPPYPPDPPPTQKLPYSDSTAGLIYHTSSAARSRRPNGDASKMSTEECKTIIHLTSAARTRPKPPTTPTRERKTTTHLITRTQQEPNSLLMKPIEQNLQRAMPSPYQSTKMHTSPAGEDGSMPRGGHGTAGYLQEEVVIKGAKHTPASPDENEMKQANYFAKGQMISIRDHYTDRCSQPKHFPRPGRPSSTQALRNNQRMKNTGLDAAPPVTDLTRSRAEMKTLCRPPIPRPLTQKTENDRGRQTKKRTKISTSHNSATKLDRPNAYWRCPFCPVEYNALMDLRAHNAKHHGGQLFRLECGQCGFQTDNPKKLREHQGHMHEEKETDEINESTANVPADAAIPANIDTTSALDESASAAPASKIEDESSAETDGMPNKEIDRPNPPEANRSNMFGKDRRLDEVKVIRNLSENSGERKALFTPEVPQNVPGPPIGIDEPKGGAVWQRLELPCNSDMHIQNSIELISNITDLDNVFSGPSTTPQWDIGLQNIEEIEVTPIKLEDDSSHVICPTCYEYLPQARYTLHRHSRDCHHPSRPPEAVKGNNPEPRHGWDAQKGVHLARGELANEENEWPRADDPPVIRKANRDEIHHWSTIRGRMTAIYKKALRKPNFDGTYNVNGQITSLQELKRQVWDLPRCF